MHIISHTHAPHTSNTHIHTHTHTFMQEGNSAERFQELYGGMPRVRTPGIKWDYTARRVLTMEWIEGVKLTNKPVCFLSVERRVVGKIRKRRVGDKRAGAVHECGKACCW